MAQSLSEINTELNSNENSVSTKEFLQLEKTCENIKDDDEEIKLIFSEIKKLSGANTNSVEGEELDDVELILKRAEDIAIETKNLLQSGPEVSFVNNHVVPNEIAHRGEAINIPVIRVTKPKEHEDTVNKATIDTSKNQYAKHNGKDTNESRRKPKARPFSASVLESKKKDTTKVARFIANSPKKINNCKHEPLIEELKDTNERVKGLELLNVQINEDNKALRKKLDQVNEQKHMIELKLADCEKFIARLGKEYEHNNTELKSSKENENRLIAELTRERNERKNLSIQHEKDMILLQDLQRQCKEMEMILRRKHPDSVSALILAAKSSSVEDNKKKLLEERIARLEQELKDKEDHFQGVLITLQEKFGDMKQKYEGHIIDVERQLMDDRKTNAELKSKINKSNVTHTSIQTANKALQTVATQTVPRPSERASSAVSRFSQNSALLLHKLKEDSYLVATIKGLQAELTVKQRTIAKINRETEELRKNLRNLQKEKEVLMNLHPQKKSATRSAKSAENILSRLNTEMEAELIETKKQKEVLAQERSSLLDSLKRTNEEFILLKKKRIQDLHTLQLAHEKELMQMNMQIYPLQEEIQLLNRTVEILQQRVRTAEDKLARFHLPAGKDMDGGGDRGRVNREIR